jgi:hypothetical protein
VSLTFSDPGNTTTWRKFRHALWTLVIVFLLVGTGATAFTLSEGPRLRSVAIDESSALQTSGSTLALRSDRAVAPVTSEMVQVSPSAAFQVESTDTVVRVSFTEPLLAATQYTVALSGVSPRGLGASSDWVTTFRTPAEELVFVRAAGEVDELVALRLDGSNPRVLYQAPGIQSFTRVGVVFAVLRSENNQTFIELIDPNSGAVDRLADTPGIEIVSMAKAAWGTTLVVTVNQTGGGGTAVRGALALIDTVGSRAPEIVDGPSGNPLGVQKVIVSSVSGNIVAWLRDQTLVRFDPLTGIVVPAGTAAELWGFDSLGDRVVAVDSLGTLGRDLTTAEETRVPAGTLDGFPVFHEFTVMAPNGTPYQRVLLPGFDDGPPFAVVTVDLGEGIHRRLVGSLQTPQTVGSIGLSPNGQYLVIESNEAASALGFAGLSREVVRQETTLVIFDTHEGVVYATEPGFSFTW